MVSGQGSPQEARALVERISERARAHDYKTLLEIDTDSGTAELLAVLPEREARQAEVHLRSARTWRSRQEEKALGKLAEARKAIAEFDLVLARGIIRKIDPAVLDEAGMAEYDELALSVEARAIEMEDIQGGLPPAGEQRKRRRFWKRS